MHRKTTTERFHKGEFDDHDGPAWVPPMWLLDRIADQKLTGGFDVSEKNICQLHRIARSVNGTCSFCES